MDHRISGAEDIAIPFFEGKAVSVDDHAALAPGAAFHDINIPDHRAVLNAGGKGLIPSSVAEGHIQGLILRIPVVDHIMHQPNKLMKRTNKFLCPSPIIHDIIKKNKRKDEKRWKRILVLP